MFRLLTLLGCFFVLSLQSQTLQQNLSTIRADGLKSNVAGYYQNSKMNFYDIQYLRLQLTVQPKSKAITGVCDYTVLVTQAVDTFAIEFKQTMQLDSVYLNGEKASFSRVNDHIYISLQPNISAGISLKITFFYQGLVAAGFFSGTDANGLDFTASVSEAYKAREWFPAKQLLNDKIDSTDIWITTGAEYKAGSNGLLKAVINLPGNLKEYRWSCRYPLNYYMPSIAVGNYLEYNNYAKPAVIAPDSVLVQNFVYNNPAYFNLVKPQLDKTPRFLEKFSELFGIYPFYKEKYGHSQANIGGGMEHATMSTMKTFDEQLVAHELAHQWFGDNVTCGNWNNIWLNESFATYSQYLAAESLPALFSTTSKEIMDNFHNQAVADKDGSVIVPQTDTYNEQRIFEYNLSYAKGATALHNLRFEMQSDVLFFNTLKKYQQQFANSFALTNDFKAVAQQVSGKNLNDFFSQKIYGEGYPIYNVTYFKKGTDSLVLQVNQTTSMPAVTPFFAGLTEYKILSPQGDTTIKLNQTSNDETFIIYYPKAPSGVAVDPNNWVLNYMGTIKEGVPPPPSYITVFPNPVRDNISVRLPPNKYSLIKLIDVNGRLLAKYAVPPGATLSQQNVHLPTGVYFLHFSGNSQSQVRKILVNAR